MIKPTPFGKLVRDLRKKRGLMLKDMADSLNKSSAYFSAVEVGKKPIPRGLVSEIAEFLGLAPDEATSLKNAAEQSSIKLDETAKSLSWEQRAMINAFARKLEAGEVPSDLLEKLKG